VKQPHTEQKIEHTETEQNTGNHNTPDSKSKTDKIAGTRAGAENVEPKKPGTPHQKA
jgi:hypothetical protein